MTIIVRGLVRVSKYVLFWRENVVRASEFVLFWREKNIIVAVVNFNYEFLQKCHCGENKKKIVLERLVSSFFYNREMV